MLYSKSMEYYSIASEGCSSGWQYDVTLLCLTYYTVQCKSSMPADVEGVNAQNLLRPPLTEQSM
jgi:hypothetical protein